MAARWIGLTRPSLPAKRRRVRREASTFRDVSMPGVLAAALLFSAAAYPEAYAQTFAALEERVTFLTPTPVALADLPETEVAIALDETEVRLLAATAWGEARSEGEDGMRAVAHVMVNRVGARFGGDLRSVIRAPAQFSVWNRGDPNRRLVQNPDRYARSGENLETWLIAQRVAREVLSGQSVDPTGGALFYHTTAIRPWWSRYGQGRQEIGAHVFYQDVPNQMRSRVTMVADNTVRMIEDVNAAATPTINGEPITSVNAAP